MGAFSGPLLAVLIMTATGDDIRLVFWLAVPFAAIAVAILAIAVREPERGTAATRKPPLNWHLVRELGRPFWGIVAVGLVFTLARFSEAFLLLRGISVGLEPRWIPLLIVVMNVVYALTSYPAGRLSDRVGRYGLLTCGLLALIAADVILALADSAVYVGAGVALWGLHMGLSQGLLASLVADTSAAELRGTAFGLFNLVSGLGVLMASLMAGLLWDQFGAPTVFWTGAGLTTAAVVGFTALRPTPTD